MKYLQKLGKSFMLPVACLPICGILIGIGYLLCPPEIQGGNLTGLMNQSGFFLVQAGSAIIENIPILFAIGVGIGMSDRNDGTGALAAIVSWLMITTLLSDSTMAKFIPSILEDPDKMLAFSEISNPFTGILAGIIGSQCYNRFKDVILPDVFAFFSGKSCVAIFASIFSIIVSLLLLIIWPWLFKALVSLGNFIRNLGALGAGIYAFFNRLLIPVGLHHTLNNMFWFDTIGIGDLTNFWAGKTSADVGFSLGMYMSGFFPCIMFGVPGAALAIAGCAKPEKRKQTFGIMLSAAICSFVCGVTEPFEFAFMFTAPLLYLVYSLLYGVFTVVTILTGFRAGFSFSSGVTDFLLSLSLPAAAKTWLIIPLGLAAFVVFYITFRFIITKWDIKTPGREEDSIDEMDIVKISEDDFSQMAAIILDGVGGKENISSIDNCFTRLRLEILDESLVNEKKIMEAGAAGVIMPDEDTIQIVVGANVQFVADELQKMCDDTSIKNNEVHHGDIISIDMDSEISFEYVIKDDLGIHARPAGEIVKIAKKYNNEIIFSSGEKTASARSLIGLLTLGAEKDSSIKVSITGEDAYAAFLDISKYLNEKL